MTITHEDTVLAAIALAIQNLTRGCDYREHPMTDAEANSAAVFISSAITDYIASGFYDTAAKVRAGTQV